VIVRPLRTLPVDLDELVIAFEAEGGELRWYLDSSTGRVILVSKEYEPAEQNGLTAAQIEADSERFVRVPAADVQHLIQDMTAFAHEVSDLKLRESLEIALSAVRPDRRFKATLTWLPEEQARWHAFRQQRCLRRVKAWLEQHRVSAVEPVP
jgi:hypothetical protein